MSQYVVYKFGGASVKDANAIRNVGNIIEAQKSHRLLIVVSAMGKTTNALEEVVQWAMTDKPKAQEGLERIMSACQTVIRELELDQDQHLDRMNTSFRNVQEFIDRLDPQNSGYDYTYDQIVVTGELVSTLMVAAYLSQKRKIGRASGRERGEIWVVAGAW